MTPDLTPALSQLAVAASPIVLGALVGFCVALLWLWRWMAGSSKSSGGDLFGSLTRVGLQSLILGAILAVVAANWLVPYLPNGSTLNITQGALWGFLLGMAAGVRWVYRRGER